MIINHTSKEIKIKLVYFGAALSGKTTSLKKLFAMFNKSGQLTSIETTAGRTLFFDFGTLQIQGGDWNIKLLLYSATGQDFYASTRPATLFGADGIIFVVDSQQKYLDLNLDSWNELNYYYQERIFELPIIVSMNKQDLPNLTGIDEISDKFNLDKYSKLNIIKTTALNGNGVIEAFKGMMQFIFPSIMIK